MEPRISTFPAILKILPDVVVVVVDVVLFVVVVPPARSTPALTAPPITINTITEPRISFAHMGNRRALLE